MNITDNGKHRCDGCDFLLESVQNGGFFCGRFAAENGTAISLAGEYDEWNGWSDPQACVQCPEVGGGEQT